MNKIIIFFLLFIISCNERKKYIFIDGQKAICNNILKDSILNGETYFYDSNNILKGIYSYHNGHLNGEAFEFYPSGEVKTKMNYLNGKFNGIMIHFDSSTSSRIIENYYYGLKSGSRLEINEKLDSIFYFFSLEGNELFKLDYDSIKGKYIDDVYKNYFFYKISSTEIENQLYKEPSIFLYKINPPKFRFTYSVIQIDSSYKTLKSIYQFNEKEFFEEYYFNENQIDSIRKSKNSYLALKLDIYDSLNNKKTEMKKLIREFLLEKK